MKTAGEYIRPLQRFRRIVAFFGCAAFVVAGFAWWTVSDFRVWGLAAQSRAVIVQVRIVGRPRALYRLENNQIHLFVETLLGATRYSGAEVIAAGEHVDVVMLDENSAVVAVIRVHPSPITSGRSELDQILKAAGKGVGVGDQALPAGYSSAPTIHRIFLK